MDESVWLTQKLMAALFAVDVRTVSEHLKNSFASSELDEDSVIRKFRITAVDGKSYTTNHYNLDAIISVGYRINSVWKLQKFMPRASSYNTVRRLNRDRSFGPETCNQQRKQPACNDCVSKLFITH